MIRLIPILFLAALATGCATIQYPDGSRQKIFLPQVATVVTVHNDCAPILDVHGSNGLIMAGVGYGRSVTIPLISTAFSGNNRSSFLTVKGFVDTPRGREYLGSLTREFYVNTYEGTQREPWTIDNLRLPNGRGGCK